jgi:hypothetical protein
MQELPDVTKWDSWRPEEVASRLAQVEAPWYVAAGWALDLFLGGGYRAHEDIEIGVPRGRFDEFADALNGFELVEITSHQTWVREPETGAWRLDIFSEPSDGDIWLCRRDKSIRLPYDDLIDLTDDGIPYGRPEVVLLFKAKRMHEKDDTDFAAVLPRLDPERRRWLVEALERVHPGHRWLDHLAP